jgi:hypothetical protein
VFPQITKAFLELTHVIAKVERRCLDTIAETLTKISKHRAIQSTRRHVRINITMMK